MTNAELRQIFDRVEKDYEQAWSLLTTFKSKDDPGKLLDFQPLLTRILAELSDAFRRVSRRRRYLIHNKTRYKRDWFTAQQRCLAHRQTMIRNAMAIGRTLGDAFAWVFYQNDHELLEKHRAYQFIELIPPGIGGKGECEFVHRVRGIPGAYILYHGITSILRMGDVSFIDLKTFRVCGFGEIKTSHLDEKSGT